MSRGRLKAVGERGSWFAKVDGERLPCVHQHWVTGTRHSDPQYQEDDPQWIELRDAIAAGKKVILTKDEVRDVLGKKNRRAFDRIGYIAIFEVDKVKADEAGLHFDLSKRLHELR